MTDTNMIFDNFPRPIAYDKGSSLWQMGIPVSCELSSKISPTCLHEQDVLEDSCSDVLSCRLTSIQEFSMYSIWAGQFT